MSGIISMPIMLFYIFICFYFFRYIKNNIEKKYLAKYFLILMLTFPFWDLIVQKGIKTFVEVSGVLEPKVFNIPEKDSNGKLESLSLSNFFNIKADNFNYKTKSELDFFLLDKVDLFYEKKLSNGTVVFYNLKSDSVSFQKIEVSRYRFLKIENNMFFFTLDTYQLFDYKKNIKISEIYCLFFSKENIFSYIRTNIFFLIGGSGSNLYYVDGLYNKFEDLKNIFFKFCL